MKSWLEQHSNRILIAALGLGAGLRWWQIGQRSFWYDEALSALIASLSLPQIVANAAGSDHPPGYYLLLHLWLVLGRDEAVIRSLSALFSLGAILPVYGLGRRLFDRGTAALAALGMALLPFQVYFAQEARMYALVVFLAAALTWLFVEAAAGSGRGWRAWVGYALLGAGGLYVHYFIGFLLVGFHLWWAWYWPRHRAGWWRLAAADGLLGLLFLPQLGQALFRTQGYLGGRAWQAAPSLLSPLTTVYYLLFGHRSPIWLFPIGLFLALTVLLLAAWESRRRSPEARRPELLLWLSLVTPIGVVLAISWLVRPIYLERSFAVATPALVLLLARGAVAAPRRSPTPYLALALLLPIGVTLGVHLFRPDPAKPPLREAAHRLAADFQPGDVSLHLQDASFMSAAWYAPGVPHLVADLPGATFTTPATHRLFGGAVVEWPTALAGADRLWLTVMPGYNRAAQQEVHDIMEATYPRLGQWEWEAIGLYLYELEEGP